jgi:hypothetical protein
MKYAYNLYTMNYFGGYNCVFLLVLSETRIFSFEAGMINVKWISHWFSSYFDTFQIVYSFVSVIKLFCRTLFAYITHLIRVEWFMLYYNNCNSTLSWILRCYYVCLTCPRNHHDKMSLLSYLDNVVPISIEYINLVNGINKHTTQPMTDMDAKFYF